jgi:hypothetical protein
MILNLLYTSKANQIKFGMLIMLLLGCVISAAWINILTNKANSLNDINKSLKTVRDTTARSLDIWFENKKLITNHISSDKQLISMVERLLKLPVITETIVTNSVTTDIREYHHKHKKLIGELGFFIINMESFNIGSIRDEDIGSTNVVSIQRPELIKKVFNGATVFVPPVYSYVDLNKSDMTNAKGSAQKIVTMFIVSPITNADGEIIAAFAINLDPESEFYKILYPGRIGKTGETYSIDSKGFLISESRFTNQLISIGLLAENQSSILSIKVLDPGVNLVEGIKSNSIEKPELTATAISVVIPPFLMEFGRRIHTLS